MRNFHDINLCLSNVLDTPILHPDAWAGPHPEHINHGKPPSFIIKDLFARGGKKYSKPLHASKILRDKDLAVAAHACPELKAFLNTILHLCGGGSAVIANPPRFRQDAVTPYLAALKP